MKRKIFQLALLLAISLNQVFAGINTYPWPSGSELLSDIRYDVRVRTYDTTNGTYGTWVALQELLSKPRVYADHWKCGGTGVTSYINDDARDMTFVTFDFSGAIEVEITQKITAAKKALRVELTPKAFGFTPHYFNGDVVRFIMDRPEYVSVNFIFDDTSTNLDSDTQNGFNIRHSMMILAETSEQDLALVTDEETKLEYTIPDTNNANVKVWNNNTDLSTLLSGDVLYFPAGEHNLKLHKDRWEKDGSILLADADQNWVRTSAEYDAAQLYRGRLNLNKDMTIYLEPGAIVYGGIFAKGHKVSICGRGIISGRKHLQHEIIKPGACAGDPVSTDYTTIYNQCTESKESFCELNDNGILDGVILLEPWHHTLPLGNDTKIKRAKTIGWASNNDGFRPNSGTTNRVFIKSNDDYYYTRSNVIVKNAVFWPGVNCGLAQIGWSVMGGSGSVFKNVYIINSEWKQEGKGNTGLISGGVCSQGTTASGHTFENVKIEDYTSYLCMVKVGSDGAGTGSLQNYLVKNITTENMFQTPGGTITKQYLQGYNETWVENWTFTNVFVEGKLLTFNNHKDYFLLNLTGTNGSNLDDVKKCRNITFNTDGNIYTITYTSTGNGSIKPKGASNVIQIAQGMDQSISILPTNGNRLKSLTVDGVKIYEYNDANYEERIQAYTFTEIQENHTIDVVFEAGTDYFDIAPIVPKQNLCIETSVPGNPGNPVLGVAEESALNISWTAPTSGGSVESYDIIVDGIVKANSVSTSIRVFGLTCDKSYKVKIIAKNCFGSSAASSEITMATSSCPSGGTYTGTPYFGTAFTLPSNDSLVMGYFDKGVEIMVFSDGDVSTTASNYISTIRSDNWDVSPYVELTAEGYIFRLASGDYWRYTVNVTVADNYTPLLYYGGTTAGAGDRKVALTIYNKSLVQKYTQEYTFPFGGTNPDISPLNYSKANLSVGEYIVEFKVNAGGARPNLNYFKFIGDNSLSNKNVVDDISSLTVYPNPFTNKLNVITTADNFALYDMSGKLLNVDFTKTSNGFILNAENLNKGMYFIRSGISTQKLIKE